MFVPRAHVYIGKPGSKRGWFSTPSKGNKQVQQKLKYYECVRMPCLVPTILGAIIGVLLILGGGFMCFIGYNPEFIVGDNTLISNSNISSVTNPSSSSFIPSGWKYPALRSLAYVGPILMGVGFFVMMVAVVLYCEIKEKYVTHVLPGKNIRNWKKDELYDMIIDEFRKNYFRGIEVPLRAPKKDSAVEKDFPTLCKALSISTPAILITPEIKPKNWSRRRTSTPMPKLKPRKAHRSRDDSWMKTSSMPNIRRKSLSKDIMGKGGGNRTVGSKLSKSCDHPNVGTITITNDAEDTTGGDNPGVDNPAFRSSPTEKNKFAGIKFTFTVDSPDSSPGDHVTKVMVHKDASLEKTTGDERISTQSLANTDKRGITLKRSSSNVYDACNSQGKHIIDSNIRYVNNIDDVIIHFDSDDEEKKQKNEITRVRSLYDFSDSHFTESGVKLDFAVFCSESHLDKIKPEPLKTLAVGDDSSVESLSLNEEILKIFETAA